MESRSILYLTFILAIIGAILHYSASFFYFYWTYWWYDVLVHFLVGATGGFSIYWGIFRSGIIFRRSFQSIAFPLTLVFICVMAIGIAWEIYEYVYDITDSHEGYFNDTRNDLILDGLGAIVAVLVSTRKKNNV